MTHEGLHYTYENAGTAAIAEQRVQDLRLIAQEHDVKGFHVERIRLPRHHGYNVNISVNDSRFKNYEDCTQFFRTLCIALRKQRREEQAEKAEQAKKLTEIES